MDASELIGAELDAAVAIADGGNFDPHRPRDEFQMRLADGRLVLAGPQRPETEQYEWSPSTRWEHGGPIIARENIAVVPDRENCAGRDHDELSWEAYHDAGYLGPDGQVMGRNRRLRAQAGPTPLIAAMRAYVASKAVDNPA